ncbi:hypothetical protein [Nocardia salmonicida]|uniref:hypothetical protein n=1 Tax=Nocardia salmonicida TaxID=53431 RepID=UPI0033CE12EF
MEVSGQPGERACTPGVAERVGRADAVVEALDEAQTISPLDKLVEDVQVTDARSTTGTGGCPILVEVAGDAFER